MPMIISMSRKRTRTNLILFWVFTQCPNRRNKPYPTYVGQSSQDDRSSSTADALIVVTDIIHAAIQVLAFLDLFCSTINPAYKRGSLYGGHEHALADRDHENGWTYARVGGHAHWRILAYLELQFMGELQGEKFIDVIKSLRRITQVLVCWVATWS